MLDSKLRLCAGAAVLAVAFSSPGMAQVQPGALNGVYSANNWTLTEEGPGAVKVPQPTVSADVAAANAAALAQKQIVSEALLAAVAPTTAQAVTNYEASVAAQKAAATAAANAAKALAAADAAKTEADALLAKLTAAKAAATAKVTSADAALTAAQTAKAALPVTATPAQIAAADAAILQAQVALDLAEGAATPISVAYNTAVSDAAAAVNARAAAQAAKGTADAAVVTTNADVAAKTTIMTTALAGDEDLAAALVAVNGAAGTNFAATYEGLKAIEAYGAAPSPVTYASNGYARATAALTAAAASKNKYISLASGALTGSEAALEAGANFETEVLGALVDHEDRITSNSAAIAKEIVDRTAEDKRIVGLIESEQAARIAGDLELRDRIASSTATAIALGGAVILPDTNFTVSGNVGIYDGAQAIAINASARVAEKTYVTGAFGGGLNKRGTVGGRVGVVFGF